MASDYHNPSAWERTLPGAMGIPSPTTLAGLALLAYLLWKTPLDPSEEEQP